MSYIPDFTAPYNPKTAQPTKSSRPADWDMFSLEECESRTLYAALVNPQACKEINATLGVDGGKFFADPLWRDIYSGLCNPTEKPYGNDELLDWLARTQGGDYTPQQRSKVLDLYANNYTSSTGVYWAERVLKNGQRRLARDLGELLVNEGADNLEAIENAMLALYPPQADKPRPLIEILPDTLENAKAETSSRISTGYDKLDALLGGGFGPGWLFVVGARTGRGKTAISVNFAVNAAIEGHRVLFYALEMSDIEILERLIRAHTGVLPKGGDFHAAGQRTASLPIKVAKARACTVTDLEVAIAAERTLGMTPDLVVVDYLQLLNPRTKTSNRQEQVADISRDLKRLARVTGIPIISPSQLRRSNEQEGDQKPALHHLRESGSIEQDADAVLLLSSNGVVDKECVKVCAELAKNRHGQVGEIYFDFHLPSQQFIEAA